ncbi:unnamed protein product [Pleuronectes platessa]|uniref:GPAT/DHAPAT C-terminal domain-containing protein n=1 Tax=Pleuronectes platessa TaxID=8262 RepID=A0A9N7VBY9_PLEPL|nr:unnamed protein product [Pleuronectes platessa]
MSSAVALHRSVVHQKAGRVYLVQEEEPARRHPISPQERVMRTASAVLMLASYRNQSLHVFVRPALVATALHITESTQRDELFAFYCFLQELFSYEFVSIPGELSQDFEEACSHLKKCGAAHISQQEVTPSAGGMETLLFLRALIQPFIDSYQVMLRYLCSSSQVSWTPMRPLIGPQKNLFAGPAAAGGCDKVQGLRGERIQREQSCVRTIGDVLSGKIPPQMLQTTPDARL